MVEIYFDISKVLGKGLSQRPDGRYNARAMVGGVKIDITNFSLPQLKKNFEAAKEGLLRKQVNALNKEMTLDEWFEQWFSAYKEPTLKSGGLKKYIKKMEIHKNLVKKMS